MRWTLDTFYALKYMFHPMPVNIDISVFLLASTFDVRSRHPQPFYLLCEGYSNCFLLVSVATLRAIVSALRDQVTISVVFCLCLLDKTER